MNYNEFLEVVRVLDEKSYSFGNETLYKMARFSKLDDRSKLAGAIWIIGRAYAASPQRRSYSGKWKVKTANDGREGFFDFIAEEINLDWLKGLPRGKLTFEQNRQDKKVLIDSIAGVLKFNLALSEAIEKFDGANKKQKYCSNHISFCSKFLHFYFPHSVFIIDSFAQDGGKSLFNGKANDEKKWRYLCNPNKRETFSPLKMENLWREVAFDQTVYDEFRAEDVKSLAQEIERDPLIDEILLKYDARNKSRGGDSSTEFKASAYIKHCVRSYELACKLKQRGIAPKTQIEGENFGLMTRLADTVFLNLKRKLSESEIEKLTKSEEE